jgi:hypothetical protein
MREIRQSGSEGGGGGASPYPYPAGASGATDGRDAPGHDGRNDVRLRQVPYPARWGQTPNSCRHFSPATVSPAGRYSHPTQPR